MTDLAFGAALLLASDIMEQGSTKGKICHAELGAKMAKPLLQELGYSQAAQEAICHCIHAHRFRSSTSPETTEAKILFDADKLDSIGAIGIGRAFLFAGQIGARLHNAEIDPANTESYSTEDTAYREFQVKMSKVREQMLTPLGRQIAERRHAFMETFFSELHHEIYGSELL
ncbi:MAG: HD domain-containing protein [Candidatus Electrothrix sp. AX5]|nr:HD domain-containing protein [Candidatus Electrothrix sp. AX5]